MRAGLNGLAPLEPWSNIGDLARLRVAVPEGYAVR